MIDRQLAAFLEEGLGIHLGTRDRRLQPNGARGLALTVDADGTHVTVYLAEVAARRLLGDLESSGQAAVSVGRPIDERACQVKGGFVEARLADDGERRLVAGQWSAYQSALEQIGIPRVMSAAWPTWPAMAIRLRVTDLFEQTPRPGTGGRLA
jgi:hypothetical protein